MAHVRNGILAPCMDVFGVHREQLRVEATQCLAQCHHGCTPHPRSGIFKLCGDAKLRAAFLLFVSTLLSMGLGFTVAFPFLMIMEFKMSPSTLGLMMLTFGGTNFLASSTLGYLSDKAG